jgi:PadR family transcriptional regulator, regulatory protein PadR
MGADSGDRSGGRLSQFRKGVVELAILALLQGGEAYGGEIVERLGSRPGLAVGAGTVYPLVSRLKKSGLIDSAWRESPLGPPRKYYRLTRDGRKELSAMTGTWRGVAEAMDELLPKEASK